MKFSSVREKARAYLDRCYVVWNDTNYFSYRETDSEGNDIIILSGADDGRIILTDRNISSYNFKSPKLGYYCVNKRLNTFVYSHRIPSRNWRAGICSRNSTAPLEGSVANSLSKLNQIKDKTYPSPQDCLSSNKGLKAFSPKYAINNGKELHFCGELVATVSKNKFQFYSEMELGYHSNNIASFFPEHLFEISNLKKINPLEEDI